MLQTFQKARELGLTVLRMWAFADGPNEWNALQPELELLDDRVLRRASIDSASQDLGLVPSCHALEKPSEGASEHPALHSEQILSHIL